MVKMRMMVDRNKNKNKNDGLVQICGIFCVYGRLK